MSRIVFLVTSFSLSLNTLFSTALFLWAILFLSRAGHGDEVSQGVSFQPSPVVETIELGQDWMKRVPGKTLLTELSIPGTHDSCALLNGFSFGFAKCQEWSLDFQMKAGVRYLDIRCRHLRDQFSIYHGVIDQKISFSRVVLTCLQFLDEHPGECLIMSIKEESSAEGNTRSFVETFQSEIDAHRNRWLIDEKTPTVQQAKGKIVLLDRVGTLGGLKWNSMNRQDAYQAPPEEKTQLIAAQFNAAIQGDRDRWFLNYCSGTVPGRYLTPSVYAKQTNHFALSYLQGKVQRGKKRLGVVVMDFPGDSLVREIILTNRFVEETSQIEGGTTESEGRRKQDSDVTTDPRIDGSKVKD